jgi:hypothetical protein
MTQVLEGRVAVVPAPAGGSGGRSPWHWAERVRSSLVGRDRAKLAETLELAQARGARRPTFATCATRRK